MLHSQKAEMVTINTPRQTIVRDYVGRGYDSHPGQDEINHECTMRYTFEDRLGYGPRSEVPGSCPHFSHSKILGCSVCGLAINVNDVLRHRRGNVVCYYCWSLMGCLTQIFRDENPKETFVMSLGGNDVKLPSEARDDVVLSIEEEFDVHAKFNPIVYELFYIPSSRVLCGRYSIEITPLGDMVKGAPVNSE